MDFFFSSLSGVLAFLGAFLSFLAAFFLMRAPRGGMREDSEGRAEKILMSARERADSIIRDADGRAGAIVDGAERRAAAITENSEALHARIEERFRRELADFLKSESDRLASAGEKLFAEYETIARDSRGEYSRIMEDVSKSVSEEARRAVAGFEEFVTREMARYERLTDRGLEEWRRTLEKEIAKKREAGFKRVEESIYRILFFVSKEVLGRALNLDDHQELVIRALDDAKRQGFFDS